MAIFYKIAEKIRLMLLEFAGLIMIASEWHVINVTYKKAKRPVVADGLRYRTVDRLLDIAEGMTVLDIGSNLGIVDYEFALRGAKLVHGIDNSLFAVGFARTLFRTIPCESKFIHADLTKRVPDLGIYDIVLFMSVYHWLRQKMSEESLHELMRILARKSKRWFVRAGDPPAYKEKMDSVLFSEGFKAWFATDTVCIYERIADKTEKV